MATARRHHQRDDGGGGGGGGHGDASIARRVVIHLDLDCFYAQVEARRFGVDGTSIPMAVQQCSGLIAVNYPARACGVKRHHTVAEAKEHFAKHGVPVRPSFRNVAADFIRHGQNMT